MEIVLAVVGALTLCAALVTGIALWLSRLPDRRLDLGGLSYSSLDVFLEVVGGALGLEGVSVSERTFGGTLEDAFFHGTLPGGRRARVSFEPAPGAGPLRARFVVEADDAPELEVTRETIASRIGRLVGRSREIEDEGFAGRYVLEGRDESRVREVLEGSLRSRIMALFERFPVESVVLGRGELVATVPLGGLTKKSCREILDLVAAAAKSVDRGALDVRILGGERRAFLGLGGKPRCGFCHADLTGEEPDLVACERCSTVVHDECWGEHGGCPVMGCPGTNPERARAGDGPRPRSRP